MHRAKHSYQQGSFKPLKHRPGTLRNRLHSITAGTLGAGGAIHQAVALPRGESCAGWVASHVVDFFNDLCIIWQVISSDPYLSTFKPGEGFPSGVEYRWAMNPHEPAMSVSAPQYVSLVLDWISQQLNDPKWFPEEQEMEVRVYSTPKFAILCGQMFRRMFRIYGIIYSSFFGTVEALEMAPHLNSCFKHFMYFCVEFALLPKREVEPLDVLVKPVRKLYLAEKAKN